MATTINYDGTNFSLSGDTSYDILSEYSWGQQYTVPINIEIIPYDKIPEEEAPSDYSVVVLKITAGKITVVSGEYNSDISEGGVSLGVSYHSGEIELGAFQISGFKGSKYKYVGLFDNQLTKESSFELEICWESLVNPLVAQGTGYITINTPFYYTAPMLSGVTGTGERGNITFDWAVSSGINNPIKSYSISIYELENSNLVFGDEVTYQLSTTPLTTSYDYTEGSLGYYYNAYVTLVPTYGNTIYGSWSGGNGIPWKPLIFRKTSSGWEEIDNIDYVKTPNGWSSAKQIFFKTDDGWMEI